MGGWGLGENGVCCVPVLFSSLFIQLTSRVGDHIVPCLLYHASALTYLCHVVKVSFNSCIPVNTDFYINE